MNAKDKNMLIMFCVIFTILYIAFHLFNDMFLVFVVIAAVLLITYRRKEVKKVLGIR